MTPRSVYVHVPFCAHRCGYCDFTLVAGRDDLVPRYLAAMRSEFSSVERPVPVDTIFLGGGTPTQLPPEGLRQLVGDLVERFPPEPGCEFSVEANPADVDGTMAATLAELGVNRVSLGAQSFDADSLQVLERDHSPSDVRVTVERLRTAGIENVSVDLIFGVPGQSLDAWRATLDAAVALEPTHVSTYGLTFEKGTAFWTRREKGQLTACDDGVEATMYELAMDRLPVAGFEQYEISNFAKPGQRCRHNVVYWQGRSFHAFGPGAARYLDGRREVNHRSVTTWLTRVERGETGIADREELDPESQARERLAIGLRLVEGIDLATFREETGHDPRSLFGPALEQHRSSDLLEETNGHLRLTRRGRLLADTVVADCL